MYLLSQAGWFFSLFFLFIFHPLYWGFLPEISGTMVPQNMEFEREVKRYIDVVVKREIEMEVIKDV